MLTWFKRKNPKEKVVAKEENSQEVVVDEGKDAPALAEPGTVAEDEPVEQDSKASSQPAEKTEGGLFKRLTERLFKTRNSLVNGLDSLFHGRKKIDAGLFDELEELLIDKGHGSIEWERRY